MSNPLPANPAPAPHVLVVEDDPVTRDLLREIVAAAFPECRLSEAADGELALRLAGEWLPDIALVDLVLPDSPVSGVLVCHALCQAARTRVLVVTGLASSGMREKCESMGIAGYIRKPFSAEQVRAHLDGWVPPSGPAVPASPSAAPAGAHT